MTNKTNIKTNITDTTDTVNVPPESKKTKTKAINTTLDGTLKTLIIAEKPSVMNDLAKVLGGCTKYDDYQENDRYVITSAVGHMLTIKAPDAYDVKRGKWTFNHLPVLPPYFDLEPIPKTEARLKSVLRLIKRKDIADIINACDAGREGELIFRYVLQYSNSTKPIKRLWLQSMTPKAIQEGFTKLRDDQTMQFLSHAARSRAEADWLVGINGTRAMTAFNSKDGGFFLTTVGRVQTPTLAIVVEREEKIRKFVSRDYCEIHSIFSVAAGQYAARYFDSAFKKINDTNISTSTNTALDEGDNEKKSTRLWDKKYAQQIINECIGQAASVTEDSKPTSQAAPALYDLTTLQREGNSRFGFSAQNTLSIAQALYEKHKVLTYPRTDSRHLPEDYIDASKTILNELGNLDRYYPHTSTALNQGWVKPDKKIFNNAKISDHFAIIPTGTIPKTLSEAEAKVYDMVVKRFIAVFYPPAESRITTRITTVIGHLFKTEGKVLINPGWLAVYGKEEQATDNALVRLVPSETAQTESVKLVELSTKPPARYSEATMLSAMEGAGKLIDDEDMKAAMVGRGLGTPATRAATIEGLLAEKYLVREGRELLPTAKSFQLMTLLRGLGVTELTQPEMTGNWEHKLSLMERNEITREAFMQEIANMTQTIVKRAKEYERDTVPGDYATMKTPCPNCGGTVQENYRRYACQNCALSLPKHPGGRTFEYFEMEEFLEKGVIGPLNGFRSKMGRPFSAVMKLVADVDNNTKKLEFDFGQDTDDAVPPDFTNQTILGKCPKCTTGQIFETAMNYVCNNTHTKACDFKTGKVILQQDINLIQLNKLLITGKTDLLEGFVSARTRRKFKAFLTLDKSGKTSFEFQEKTIKSTQSKDGTKDSNKDNTIENSDTKKSTVKTTAKKAVVKKVTVKKTAVEKLTVD
jgi:DNA topoisomerase-3